MNKAPVTSLLVALCLTGCASQAPLRQPLPPGPSVRSGEFRAAMGALVGAGWCGGNAIRTLSNGDEIFPAMLVAISSARHTINFETFVFESGDIPAAFAAALEERARAGVQVHVTLDAIGAAKSLPYHQAMREAGVDLIVYHSPWWLDLRRDNYRTHRKLLIVDGRVGFIGGVGISDLWKGNAASPAEIRDLHYRIEGPVVAQLQGAFEDNWLNSRHTVLVGPEYFPALNPAGNVVACAFPSSPLRGRAALELMAHLAIASARHTLDIENAYFLPDSTMVNALCAAARHGVRVRILMPGKYMDEKAVQRHSRKTWPRLLAAGVQLYAYDPTMLHCKLLVADDFFVSLGSGNLDPRSLRINDEANLNMLDAAFAQEQTCIFESDLRLAHLIRLHGTELIDLPRQTAEAPLESQL